MIIQVPRGGAVHRQLAERPPPGLDRSDVVIEAGDADAHGNLEGADAGEVVISVPSPESLSRDRDEVRRVIAHAGTGTEPLVVVVEAAEELREDELAIVFGAVEHAKRPVILRVIRSA